MSPSKQFKVIIVGAANVGKTCLLALFTHDTCKRHLDHYIPTTGIDFCPKSFEIDGETYNFHFVDVSGIWIHFCQPEDCVIVQFFNFSTETVVTYPFLVTVFMINLIRNFVKDYKVSYSEKR